MNLGLRGELFEVVNTMDDHQMACMNVCQVAMIFIPMYDIYLSFAFPWVSTESHGAIFLTVANQGMVGHHSLMA